MGRLLDEGWQVAALARAESDAQALARFPEFLNRPGWRALAGDVREPLFGRTPEDFAGLDAILHLAAQPNLAPRASLEALRLAHVGAARHLAEAVQLACVPRVLHFSTAFVPASASGALEEAPASSSVGGANPYETSKAEAERLLSDLLGSRVEILRPGIALPEPSASADRIAASPLGAFLMALRADSRGQTRIPADPAIRAGFCRLEDVVEFALARLRDESIPRETRFWNLVPEPDGRPSFADLARLGEKLGMYSRVIVDPCARNRLLETWAPYTLQERRWTTDRSRDFIRAAGLPEPGVDEALLESLLTTWRDARLPLSRAAA